MSAQDSTHPAIQQLLHHIETSTTTCTVSGDTTTAPPFTFVSQDAINRYFQDHPKQISKAVDAACGPYGTVNAKWVTENCPIGFCILLGLGYGSYIKHFVSFAGLHDEKLPFWSQPVDFPHIPGNPDFFEQFREAQWRFFPITFSPTPSVKFQTELPLPIVERKKLRAHGLTADLYRIKIHHEYDKACTGEEAGGGHRYYALKTYRGKNAEVYYRTEVDNFAKLCLEHREPPEGLIRFHCGFEHNGTYNLLMDYATFGTLAELFRREEPPSSGAEIIVFWKRFSLCIQALTRIHELDLSEDDQEGFKVFQGWHQDIRPENILIHKCKSTLPHEFLYMLGDLGLSHFVRMSRSNDDPEAIDTMGTRTYGAPEIYRHSDFDETRRIPATRAIDIWSLGCVMLEICVWIGRGKTHLKTFRAHREAENKRLGSLAQDCFHDGAQPHPRVSRVVDETIEELPDHIRKSDKITVSILGIVERMIRADAKTRAHAPDILASLEKAIKLAERQALETHGRSISEPIGSSSLPESPTSTVFTDMTTLSDPRSTLKTRNQSVASDHEEGNSTGDTSAGAIDKRNLRVDTHSKTRTASTSPGRPHSQSAPATSNYNREHDLTKRLDALSPHVESNEIEPASSSPALSERKQPRNSTAVRREDVPYLSLEDAINWRRSSKSLLFRRKTNLQHEHYRKWLDHRDHVFLIDDSRTMRQYKDHVTTLLDPLSYIVKDGDPDGAEVHFTVSSIKQQSKKSSVLTSQVAGHNFGGRTDISGRLGRILRQYRVELDGKREARQVMRPLSIYILTDGVWEGGKDAQPPIREIIAVLRKYGYERKQVGIQFISFGNDEEGLRRLDELDSFGKQADVGLDIVDTESSKGNVWKMLLGAIDKTFDDEYDDTAS